MKSSTTSTRPRILVIDDMEAIHADFRKVLCSEGGGDSLSKTEVAIFIEEIGAPAAASLTFDLDCASQGADGLAMVNRALKEGRPYALAFVDIRMPPGWDGVETLAQIWKIDPDLQAVICTAHSDYSLDQILDALHPNDRLLILKKPFDNIEVRQMACALTEKWRLGRAARCRMENLEKAVAERTQELEQERSCLKDSLTQLQQAHAQLLQSEKMASIGQLAAGVAHEINNPIGFISSNLNSLAAYSQNIERALEALTGLLQDCIEGNSDTVAKAQAVRQICEESDLEYITADLQKLVEESMEGARRVRQIVVDLRDFSHVDSPDIGEDDLNKLLDKTINVAWNELKYKAEVLREYGSIPTIRCYGGKLGQLFLNLLVNAAQAIAERGRILVRTEFADGRVSVEIEDTGSGIPPENLNRVFEPFFTTKDVGKGTGMGLHIAYKIVEAHGGKISVRSKLGEGTVFRVELPVDGPSEAQEEEGPHESDVAVC
jgi:two-component system, NtrC family, sensor kinase